VKVRKAVVPAAGLGTRFLPVTKTVPKEMLPIVDRPLISFVVEEAAYAGIEHIVLISGCGKSAIEDFFDRAHELENRLELDGKTQALKDLRHWQNMVQISSVRQQQALGLGHAVLCAEKIIGNDPFAVLLGDEIMRPAGNNPLPVQQLAAYFEKTDISCISVMKVEDSEVSKYGMIRPHATLSEGCWSVEETVEKPQASQAPSHWAIPGRYVFTAEIFEHLQKTVPGRGGEIQLTDALNKLALGSGVHALQIQSRRYDAGDKLGYLQANIEMGLEHPEVATALRNYLLNLGQKLSSGSQL
jgi:UTP--glucose-1-phosphate uridylyltransferase